MNQLAINKPKMAIQKEIQKKQNEKSKKLVPTRGRTFQGKVIKKFSKRITLEFERTIYIPKYERYLKKKTKIHARIPEGMEVSKGDLIKVRECRPLSKIIHFLVIDIIKKSGDLK